MHPLDWLVRLCVPPQDAAALLGDLSEEYDDVRRTRGPIRARTWYLREALVACVHGLPGRIADAASALRWLVAPGAVARDVRYAARALARQPGYAAAAILTLALGVGANTAMFSVLHAVVLRPLPYHDPSRLFMVFRTVPSLGFVRSSASFPDYLDWRDRTNGFASLGAYAQNVRTLRGLDGAEEIRGAAVTASLFDTLGVPPRIGRAFTADDDTPESSPVVIVSDGFWRAWLGADPAAVGRDLALSDVSFTIVGVMPASFYFPDQRAQFWIPLRRDRARSERDANFLTVIGRARPGASAASLQREMSDLAARIDRTAPAPTRTWASSSRTVTRRSCATCAARCGCSSGP